MKPQNILIFPGGKVKLCDFGFARNMTMDTMVLTSIKVRLRRWSALCERHRLFRVLHCTCVLNWSMRSHTIIRRIYGNRSPSRVPYRTSICLGLWDVFSMKCITASLLSSRTMCFIWSKWLAKVDISHSHMSLSRWTLPESVKWPKPISPDMRSFLEGLLTKDSTHRLTWPDLLQHPFVRTGVKGTWPVSSIRWISHCWLLQFRVYLNPSWVHWLNLLPKSNDFSSNNKSKRRVSHEVHRNSCRNSCPMNIEK